MTSATRCWSTSTEAVWQEFIAGEGWDADLAREYWMSIQDDLPEPYQRMIDNPDYLPPHPESEECRFVQIDDPDIYDEFDDA